MGPGLITGASDDDPSGIATYSQVGAQFGYGLTWTMLLSFPLMAAIQMVSARIGSVTGKGVAANLRAAFPRRLVFGLVVLLLVANTINIGADIAAMGEAVRLLIGGPEIVYALVLAVASILLEMFAPYRRYARILAILTLSLLAYVASVAIVNVDWSAAVRATLVPSFRTDAGYLAMIVAVLGTTISPYLFFWQAAQETEEQACEDKPPLHRAADRAPEELRRIRIDTLAGMGVSNAIAFCIIVTAAATLHAHGKTDIGTAAEAAAALEPVAGNLARTVFALGIIGTGLLSVPVLAASSAYALGEMLRVPVGLDRKPHQARGFYVVIAASILAGLGMEALHISPMKALLCAAVINGVAAVPAMIMLMLLVGRRSVMGPLRAGLALRLLGWMATAVMAAAVLAMLAQAGLG